MNLDNRLNRLEGAAGSERTRPLIATVGLSHAPDPPRHFQTEEALDAWFAERGRERPVVVLFEPRPVKDDEEA